MLIKKLEPMTAIDAKSAAAGAGTDLFTTAETLSTRLSQEPNERVNRTPRPNQTGKGAPD
jgi:hypothetical protein